MIPPSSPGSGEKTIKVENVTPPAIKPRRKISALMK
jgi:hypothetical protein